MVLHAEVVQLLPVPLQTSDLFISLLESVSTDAEPHSHAVLSADNIYSVLDVSGFLHIGRLYFATKTYARCVYIPTVVFLGCVASRPDIG